MIFRTSWATVALILATTTASAQAGLVLDIGSTTIASGGTGFVDLTITTDGTDTSLGQYNFDVVIDGAGTHNALGLVFMGNEDVSSISSYVFFNNSSGFFGGFSMQSGLGGPDQEYAGGDFVSGSSDTTVSGTTRYLLARLDLSASASTVLGDEYQINAYVTQDATNPTFYSGVNSNTPFGSLFTTVDPGTVTIAAAVPEPSAFVNAVAGLVVVAGFLTCRRLGSRSMRSIWCRSFRA
jgi:hypothetical protein